MKVAYINTVAGFGCTGVISLHLLNGLIGDGQSGWLFYGRGIPDPLGCSTRFAFKWEVRLHGLQTRLLGTHAQGSVLSTYHLLHLLQEYEPDIIHLHNLHGYYVNLNMLLGYCVRKDIPLVWTFHDAWPFTGHCAYPYDCEKWMTGCGNCPRKGDYPKSIFFDRSARQWEKKQEAVKNLNRLMVVTPSRWLAELAERSFFNSKTIRVVNNGIDTEHVFYPEEAQNERRTMGIPEKHYLLATVVGGFKDLRKGGHHLEYLVRRLKEQPFHFIVAGWEEKQTEVPANMTILPVLRSPEEMAQFYRMADAFLLLSEADNFPTVCIEALACGTPVVGFTTGGTAEQVDLLSGRLVPAGDRDKLEALLCQISSEPGIFSRSACRSRAELHYSVQSMYRGYHDCYNEILSQ